MSTVYIVMGVSGSGKTTVGKLLASRLGLDFYDADDFHSSANIQKMSSGIPLNDTDRLPWLKKLSENIREWNSGNGAVLACSALKESYRNQLSKANKVKWIILNGDYELIRSRMKQRREHYMESGLLRSQFDTLELPSYGLHFNITNSPEKIVAEILSSVKQSMSDFGLVGLGVMGKSLAKNLIGKGVELSVYNRAVGEEAKVVKDFISEMNSDILQGFTELEAFVHSIRTPRKILLMIPAGAAVDEVLDGITPFLTDGDVIMDGGNSHFNDTRNRLNRLTKSHIDYLGIGISGGESGALSGPSMMVGGISDAYDMVKDILEEIAAKDHNNKPCVSYLGPDGCGHFVKMIHNGIEYAEMQILAEVFSLLRHEMTYDEIADLFDEWGVKGQSGYLLKLTADILRTREEDHYLLDRILDVAAGKGTGAWSVTAALELGVVSTMIDAAVNARYVSVHKEKYLGKISKSGSDDLSKAKTNLIDLMAAYRFARMINHHQGFRIISEACRSYGWNISLSEVARIWTNGCIIKSELMDSLVSFLQQTDDLFMHSEYVSKLVTAEAAIRTICKSGLRKRIPLPCFNAAVSYWFALQANGSSANLIQAQRDYFGAHGYRRTDRDQSEQFTTIWNKTNG